MKKHKIQSVMVTRIYLERMQLITKEKTESYYKGGKYEKESVNDDLESFFENIRLGKETEYECAVTYFLPKLTENELELAARRDTSYLQSFSEWNPDVNETEMMLSESDSKYVRGLSVRRTFVIENSFEASSELSYDNSTENIYDYSSEHENLIPSENQSCFENCCNCSLQ